MKNIKNLKEVLIEMSACEEAVDWVGSRDLYTAILDCEHADWMLWFFAKTIDKKGFPTHKQVVKMACLCVRTAFKYIPKGKNKPLKVIETTEKWVDGKVTLEEVYAAAHAAYAVAYAAAFASDVVYIAANKKMCDIIRNYLQANGLNEKE